MVTCRALLAAWAVVCVSVPASAAEIRTWTDRSGNQVQGQLVEVTPEHQVVLQVEQEQVEIPLAVFSEADQKHLAALFPGLPIQPTEPPPTPATNPIRAEYHPPPGGANHFYCSRCDGRIPASVEVGENCPHCGAFIAFEKDENGNIVKHANPLTNHRWLLRGGITAAIFVFGSLIKLRRMLRT